MPNMSEILKKLRKEKGLTQAQLAERLNLSQATVASWEVGKRRPDIEFMPTLAEFYGVSVDELYGQEPTIDESMYEAFAIRDRLRRDPSYRLLFDAARTATPEHIKAATAVLKALEPDQEGYYPDE